MRINNYIKDTNVTATDKWIGTDSNNNNETKNFTPTSLAEYYNHSQVIDSPFLKFTYQTLNIGEQRSDGTISFVTERGPSVLFSSISTFLMSNKSLKGNSISQYLNFINGDKIILSRGENINEFGVYKITNITPYIPDNNFFVVDLEFIQGNGSILEDKDYLISLYSSPSSSSIPTLQSVVNSGNGISNYRGTGTAFIQSTNFVNNRQLYLNKDEFPTIKIIDNFDSSHNLTIDLDAITLNDVSYSWSTITSPVPSVTTAAVTADVEVGGVAAQQVIPIGTTLQTFVEDLLTKTFNPTLTPPSFSLTNNAGVREIGSSSAITLTFNFNQGNILGNIVSGIWQPTVTQGYRAGTASSYSFDGVAQGSNTKSITPTLLETGNTFNATVTYATGIQPLNSKGGNFDIPLAGATSTTQSTTVQGIYPYFWYKSSSPITAANMQSAINSGTANKVVSDSTGTISIPFAATGQYLAVAYPSTSTTKTVWYVTALSNGSIPGGVFGSATILACTTSLWSNVNYKIHVSPGLITESTNIQLRNS